MIELALRGGRAYRAWILLLIALSTTAVLMFWLQLTNGLTVTAMSRAMPWGFYIAQLTFLVGVAASAVVVVLPYYLHDVREFGKLTILGEFLAIPAVVLAMLFVAVDVGQPQRLLNLLLYPSPRSPMFWDFIALFGYLVINLVIGWKTLQAERNGFDPPAWLRPLVYLSIPMAISIHTVTAFLYCGLVARPYWLTAVLAPRFLASAFASGPAILLLLCLLLRRVSSFDVGDLALRKLAKIMTYAMIVNVFLLGLELFTAVYSGSPEHLLPWQMLFWTFDGSVGPVVWFMWISLGLAAISVVMLLSPSTHGSLARLAVVSAMVVSSIWIDKGAGMITGGMNPSPLGETIRYIPSWVEIGMGLGLYSFGALILTVLIKVAVSIRGSV